MEARAPALVVAAVLLAVTLGAPPAAPQAAPSDDALRDLEWPDVALSVRLPGLRGPMSRPVLTSDAVYTVTSQIWEYNWGAPHNNSDSNALWRIDLATGDVRELAAPPWQIGALATDGERLLVAGNYTAAAFTFEGEELWTSVLPLAALRARSLYSIDAIALDGTFYVFGTEWTSESDAGSDSWNVYAIDPLTGDLRWHWSSNVLAGAASPDAELLARLNNGLLTAPGTVVNEGRFSVIGERAYVTGFAVGTAGAAESYLYVIDATNGELVDVDRSNSGMQTYEWAVQTTCGPTYGTIPEEDPPNIGSVPIGTDRVVYYKLDKPGSTLHAYNPQQGTILWTLNDTRADDDTAFRDFGTVGVARDDTLFMPFVRTLKRIATTPERVVEWTFALPSDQSWARTGMAVTDTTLYGASVLDPPPGCHVEGAFPVNQIRLEANHTILRAHDPATGEERWTFGAVHAFPARFPYSLALHTWTLSEGRIALAGYDGSVIVLGRTPASPTAVLPPIDVYPAVDAPVVVDLSGSTPGVAGAITAYRAIWGDGTDSGWQESPTLTHAYASAGDREARFMVQGAGNQTASETMTFLVGTTPPAEPAPSLAQRAVDVLSGPAGWIGLAATFVQFFLFLYAGFARRRSRLAREIRAAERAFAAASGDRSSALAVMIERRARASRLLLKRKLTTSEHASLVSRIAGLEGTLGGPATEAPPGEIVSGTMLLRRYKIVRLLGEGAYGRAYLADDTTVARQVVLKLLRERMSEDGLREARAIGAIRHPNVVTLYDVAQLGERPLLVMEYAEGGSLRDRIARGAISTAEFGALSDGLLRAIEAVHAAGAIHRDIKPSNVLLAADGSVKLADFGIARLKAPDGTMGEASVGVAVGTLRYMSPEQARGRRVTERSDLYSAAVTLYEAWTGAPFVAAQPGVSEAEMHVRVAGAGVFDRDVGPLPLRAWFARALAPDPAERFASADEMRDALREAWTLQA